MQARVGAPDVVFEGDWVAQARAQFAGGPVIQRDAIVARRSEFGVERCHQRIGNFTLPDTDTVGQVRQNGLDAEADRSGRRGHRVADQRAVAFERKAAGFLESADAEANVGQGVVLLQVYRSVVYQDGVDFSGLIQLPLQARQRHVHGADIALLGA